MRGVPLERLLACVGSPTTTNCCGSFTGSIFSSNPFKTVKTDVFAPFPSANVRTATRVNPGFLRNWRTA